MDRTSINNMSKVLLEQLGKYNSKIRGEVILCVDKHSSNLLNKIKNDSPKSKNGGRYKKGWTKRKEGYGYRIYNKTAPQLTHLLEFGHATSKGGRARAFPHILSNYKNTEKKLIDDIKKVVMKTG